MVQPGDVVLFQGDSITDCGRDRDCLQANQPDGLGDGYVNLIADRLIEDYPNHGLRVYNRGISGQQIIHLAERWHADCIGLQPTILSILIGVNDTWRGFDGGVPVAVDLYEQVYRQLITEARQERSSLRVVLCEPFVLKTGVVTEAWLPEIKQRIDVVHRLAEEFDATLVSFQRRLGAATSEAPAHYWLRDGVHPTPAGHQLLADTWWETFMA